MKYFTKEWFLGGQGNHKKMKEEVDSYQKHYRTIEKLIPSDLKSALHIHDCDLIKMNFIGADLIIEFDPTHALSDTTKLVFKNAVLLENDEPNKEFCSIYNEIYLVNGRYEIHILFSSCQNSAIVLKQIIVQSDNILFETQFRNVGKCVKCGKAVGDPTKKKYDKRLPKGVYSNNNWLCNSCYKNS